MTPAVSLDVLALDAARIRLALRDLRRKLRSMPSCSHAADPEYAENGSTASPRIPRCYHNDQIGREEWCDACSAREPVVAEIAATKRRERLAMARFARAADRAAGADE